MSEEEVINGNIDLHEEEAERYDSEKREIYNPHEQQRIKFTLSNVKENLNTGSSKLRALDVGCGTGNILEKLSPLFDEVVGIDLSDDMLSVAKSKFKSEKDLNLVRGRAAHLPFPDEYFDVVSAYSLIHHLPDFSDPVSEISRVLKKGGILYLDHEPVKRSNLLVKLYIKLSDTLNGKFSKGLPPYEDAEGRENCDYHLHHGENGGIPTSEILDLCKDNGLEILTDEKYLTYRTKGKNPFYPFFKPFISSEWLLIGRKSH